MQCNTKTYKRNKQLSDSMNVTPVMVSKLHWYKWWCWQSWPKLVGNLDKIDAKIYAMSSSMQSFWVILCYFGFTYGTSAVPLKDAAKEHIQSHRKPFVWLPGQHAHLMNVVQIINITPTWPYQVTIQGINLHTSLQKSCCSVLWWLFHIFWKRFLAAHIVRVLQ